MNVDKIKADFQIIGTTIKSLNVQNDFVFMDISSDDLEREIDVCYSIVDIFEDSPSSKDLIGILEMTVIIGIHNEKKSMNIELVIDGGFDLSDSTDKELMKRFLEVNGCAAVYSIARGIISSITSQICINGAITLPMINVFRLKEESDIVEE